MRSEMREPEQAVTVTPSYSHAVGIVRLVSWLGICLLATYAQAGETIPDMHYFVPHSCIPPRLVFWENAWLQSVPGLISGGYWNPP